MELNPRGVNLKVKSSRSPSNVKKTSPEKPKTVILSPYETIFIVKPLLTEAEISAIIEKVKEIIETQGGEVVSTDNWGKKKLAYEVKKERKGIYIVLHFKGPGDSIQELERHYRFSESIIKYMTLRIEAEALGKSQAIKEEKAYAYRGRDSRGWR